MLFIRTDASSQIGTGHVMRCIALAQAWQDAGSDAGDVVFLCAEIPDALETRLKDSCIDLVRISAAAGSMADVEETLSAVAGYGNAETSWFVTDGYPFNADYQRSLRRAGFRLLVIDDYQHLDAYECDILLNQNAGSESYAYDINLGARKLQGPHYALLRREFTHLPAAAVRARTPAKKLLITLGGADPDNCTSRILMSMAEHDFLGFETRVIIGGGNRHREDIERVAAGCRNDRLEVLVNVQDMPAHMAWADLAITAGGSTCWELCRYGVPMLIVILAENQAALADALHEKGIAVNLGWGSELSADQLIPSIQSLLETPNRLAGMSALGAEYVDGKGAGVIVSVMKGMTV